MQLVVDEGYVWIHNTRYKLYRGHLWPNLPVTPPPQVTYGPDRPHKWARSSQTLGCSTLIKNKIKFSSYRRKFRMEQLQSHIWLNICAFPHILGSPFLFTTLQLLNSEFPYKWGKKKFFSVHGLNNPELYGLKPFRLCVLFEARKEWSLCKIPDKILS